VSAARSGPGEAFGRWDHLRPLAGELAERYRSAGYWTEETLGEFLDERLVRDQSLKARVWSDTRPYSGRLSDVRDLAAKVAAGLAARGIGPGDVVAFQLPNWLEAAATFYALCMVGAVVTPIVHFYGPKEVGFILQESRARMLVTADRFARRDYLEDLDGIHSGLDWLESVYVVGESSSSLPGFARRFGELVSADPLERSLPADPDWPALLAYTSGTTRDPKGVVHSHRTIVFEVRQLAAMQADRQRPLLVGAPVGHGIGMLSALLVPRELGHPLSLIDVWDPPRVLDAMVEADLAAGSGSTYFLTSLLDSPGFGPEHLERMREIGLGGSPVPGAVAERAEELGISIVRSYGSTEHPSTTGSTHSEKREKRLHTDGRPRPGVEIRLVDEAGDPVAQGEPGEVLSRGPDRFVGYSDPALTREAIDGQGWFATGDIGVLDAEGFLTITDRKKDIIIRGGEKVSAAEVEEQLARMEGVAEVAVVAAPDQRLGEHGCAFFRMASGAPDVSLDAMRSHLAAAGLARQKWPEELRVLDELPRTPSGKVKKYALRELLERSST
jgi:acyl-CoA synthetase (AMP-forming)/AMP-acid ligase II